MTRVKRGTISLKRRRNVLKQAKGFRHGAKSKERKAIETLRKAGKHAFNDRRKKKGDKRALWQIKISAGLRGTGVSFSKFINLALKNETQLDRKVLAQIAEQNPESFKRVVEQLKK
jgi:large subunit ribosomal protein L20